MKIIIWFSSLVILGSPEKLMPAYSPSSPPEMCRLLVWTAKKGLCMIASMHWRNPGVWGNASVCIRSVTTPLHEAVKQGHNPTVRMLLGLGADVNAMDFHGRTPLHLAVNSTAHSSIVFDLLHAGARVNAADSAGDTPLHVAVRNDLRSSRSREDTPARTMNTNSLLVAGAQRSVENDQGETPVSIAMHESEKMTMFMLEEKVLHLRFPLEFCEDVWRIADTCPSDTLNNGTDIFGRSKLMRHVIFADNDSISDEDLEGSEINAKDIYNRTALHEASRLGKIETVKVLLGKKARVNLRDWLGQTPLHLASICLREDVKNELQNANANMKAPDRKGRTPEEIARFVT